MGEMGKGEMGTAHAGKPPSLPRELRTPLVIIIITLHCHIPRNSAARGEKNLINECLLKIFPIPFSQISS
jgi:hypothetical protein